MVVIIWAVWTENVNVLSGSTSICSALGLELSLLLTLGILLSLDLLRVLTTMALLAGL